MLGSRKIPILLLSADIPYIQHILYSFCSGPHAVFKHLWQRYVIVDILEFNNKFPVTCTVSLHIIVGESAYFRIMYINIYEHQYVFDRSILADNISSSHKEHTVTDTEKATTKTTITPEVSNFSKGKTLHHPIWIRQTPYTFCKTAHRGFAVTLDLWFAIQYFSFYLYFDCNSL